MGPNVINIGVGAFQSSSLSNVTLSASITSIAESVFEDCPYLTSINIPYNVTSIGDRAFESAALTSVAIPISVTNIGNYAFATQGFRQLRLYFQGNAPVAGSGILFGNGNVGAVYYLAGTTGWGATFGGVPTVALSPQQISSAGLQNNARVFSAGQNNEFGFTFTGTNTQVVVVEATSNFSNPDWQPIQTNTMTGNFLFFGDPAWSNYPARFYRVRSL